MCEVEIAKRANQLQYVRRERRKAQEGSSAVLFLHFTFWHFALY